MIIVGLMFYSLINNHFYFSSNTTNSLCESGKIIAKYFLVIDHNFLFDIFVTLWHTQVQQ